MKYLFLILCVISLEVTAQRKIETPQAIQGFTSLRVYEVEGDFHKALGPLTEVNTSLYVYEQHVEILFHESQERMGITIVKIEDEIARGIDGIGTVVLMYFVTHEGELSFHIYDVKDKTLLVLYE